MRCWTAAAWMVLSICNCNTTGVHWRSSCGGGACHSLFLLGAADSRRSLATLQVGSGGCVPTSSLKVSWRGCCFSGGLPHSLLSTGAAGPRRSLASPANTEASSLRELLLGRFDGYIADRVFGWMRLFALALMCHARPYPILDLRFRRILWLSQRLHLASVGRLHPVILVLSFSVSFLRSHFGQVHGLRVQPSWE